MKRCSDVYLCGRARSEKSSQVLRRDGIALLGKWNHNFTILNYNVTWALENYSGGVHSVVCSPFSSCVRESATQSVQFSTRLTLARCSFRSRRLWRKTFVSVRLLHFSLGHPISTMPILGGVTIGAHLTLWKLENSDRPTSCRWSRVPKDRVEKLLWECYYFLSVTMGIKQ